MVSLGPAVLGLRRDARILKLPPYLSALCILVGVVWLLLLPLNDYSRQTYVSENALLPGQVHTYFGGSEHNVFRAYRHEVHSLVDKPNEERVTKLQEIFRSAGLKVATQKYGYEIGGRSIKGENVYAVLQGPRADATEAIVLVAAWRNMNGEINHSGVALMLTLARYFKRWSLWSKDIIFLIPQDSTAGPQAWVDAYHDAQAGPAVEPLSLKSGALQGAIAVDYPAGPWGHRFEKLHIHYDGIDGQLPNLDLFNTAVSIASGQTGIGCTIQRMYKHDDSYKDRLQTMLRGMVNQGLGHATGPHSSFIPYHIDAITLQTVGSGWHDEMTLGKTVESLTRSLNNLLEHLHQSFFFYLLMQANRFVSIGTYLPSAMLVAANFSITAIALWVQSGRPPKPAAKPFSTDSKDEGVEPEMTLVKEGDMTALVPASAFEIVERKLFLPVAFVCATHFLGLIPLYLFNRVSESALYPTFFLTALLTPALPLLGAYPFVTSLRPTLQHLHLIQCFSLLLLGLFLSALATLNFSLAFLVGLAAAPLSFVRPVPGKPRIALAAALVLSLVGPGLLLCVVGRPWLPSEALGGLLKGAVEAWAVNHAWTLQVVVWLVWWPAWVEGAAVLAVSGFVEAD
ncbi:hypothetical protein W97_08197 [Coniosporium apollinis CBS 100218]|uniref:Glycosylphosphatidylinositol transamidase n=1 Tax=Coniosporium apollinis (strain CBS 100218) TaxID=1168221 RepID=R7Z4J2_CONA1|nr:uncharacterized protein W97_08197 [Coniosporium apollinis CBS 100218]EON68939.1 hypothetical protein W97_08197 [Coniosporium apollinis CBS 100218]